MDRNYAQNIAEAFFILLMQNRSDPMVDNVIAWAETLLATDSDELEEAAKLVDDQGW